MTMRKTKKRNPFYSGTVVFAGERVETFAMSTEDRIGRVKTFAREQCLAALEMQDLQKSVFIAVNRRLKELEKKKP